MLVGRDAETTMIDRLLATAREGHSAKLVVRGEAGVGKSALLEHALEHAERFTVLRGAGVEIESELPYAAVHQVLRPLFDRIDSLPEPQAAALRAAFALSNETVDERFRVSLGVLGLLADAAEEQPVVCVVDDAQWLDGASADALMFAARRLEADSVALLFAARDDEPRAFTSPGLPELRISPLPPDAARALLKEHLGPDTPTTVIEWLVENANGNPLALMELPELLSAAQLGGREPFDGTLLPTTSVERAYLERVQALPVPARTLLLAAAAESTGSRATISSAAVELGIDPLALADAEAVGLIRVDPERIEFRHPLVRSAIYRGSGFADRERVHRALAHALEDTEDADRRAWHRAAATVGPDADVADELETTAERAALRSGHAAAAAALRRAAELSVDPTSEARRLIGAARAAWQAGQPERATMLLEWASPLVSDLRLRAELSHVRGVIEWRCGSLPDACATLIAGATELAPLDGSKALEMLFDAGMAAMDYGDYARVVEVGEAAAAVPADQDEEHAFLADMLAGVGGLIQGKTPEEVPGVREAIARSHDFDDPRLLMLAAVWAPRVGESALETPILKRAAMLARASGAVDTLTFVLEAAAVQGLVAGQFGVAADAAEGLRLAREAGLPNAASHHRAVLAWLAAVKGQEDECRSHATEVLAVSRANGHALATSIAEWALAILELGNGQVDAAAKRFVALSEAPPGAGHPYFVRMLVPDLVEACVRAGLNDQAEAAFSAYEAYARPGAPTWAHALAARCRGLLAPESQADGHFEQALELHADSNRSFDRARTGLLYGEFLRRGRRRTDSREHLRAALEAFEDLGAAPWAERARAELRASGETARKRDPSTIAQLTPQELQISRLVADGASNKEVAAQLFLSPRTIDYHLRKVFMKLGISSRAELIKQGVGQAAAAAASLALAFT